VDSTTKKPILEAVVTLSTAGDGRPMDAVAWTDEQGRFGFGFLPAGPYTLKVNKDDYVESVFGRRSNKPPGIIVLAPGETRTDFVIRLVRVATISGTVLDEDGDPIPNATIKLFRRSFVQGEHARRFIGGWAAVTDSHGRYTVPVEDSVEFLLAASWMEGGIPQQYVRPPQFYPGVADPPDATRFSPHPGEHIGAIDFRLVRRPALTLSGRVMLPPGIQVGDDSFRLRVTSAANPFDAIRAENLGPTVWPHYFAIGSLTPGTYTVTARLSAGGRQYKATRRVQIGDDAVVPELNLTLEPGIELTGQVSVVGPDAAKHPVQYVTLVSTTDDIRATQTLRVPVTSDGGFRFPNVVADSWDVGVAPIAEGSFIKAIKLGDEDVLMRPMEITSSTAAQLKIEVSTRGATVEGDVSDPGDRPARAEVILAPTGKYRDMPRFYRSVTTGANGHFKLTGIPPGSYKLYAFEQAPGESGDAEALSAYEKLGVDLDLKEGQNFSQNLRLINAEAQP